MTGVQAFVVSSPGRLFPSSSADVSDGSDLSQFAKAVNKLVAANNVAGLPVHLSAAARLAGVEWSSASASASASAYR